MARKSIPTALADAEIFINGSNSLSGVGEIELPTIEFSTVTTEQFGMTAEYEAILLGHFKKMDCKIKMECIDDSLLDFNNGSNLLIEAKGVIQSEDTITRRTKLVGLDATIEGKIKKFDGPKIKPGDKLESSFELTVSYYKLAIGNKNIIELDVFNPAKTIINGQDNSLIRRLLGLI